ncbi:L-cystine uptake protein TcyP [Gracilibacillus boraciitolerans JCM 21714]|uniref:L-cystine uptake protein TcyP n=1 Tax=Gracilibacillus boraciitolerans JCM 21714 TaxID=1298598 RepID=W4VH95_9BACI|nr:L-cystine uptake protein TcyP [Gracilibacillus boraciitolerans JCM 21714]
MDTVFIIINIAIMLIFIGILFAMQKKYVSFSKRVFAGLGLGILLGAFLQIVYSADSEVVSATTDWYNIVGRGYVRFLMMIVIPLVMVSIIQSIINLEKSSELGKMSAWIIGILVTTAMVAAMVGIASASIFNLNADQIEMGQAEEERGLALEERLGSLEGMTTPQKILEFIPSNIFLDMTGERATSVIAVVIFSIIIGIAVLG